MAARLGKVRHWLLLLVALLAAGAGGWWWYQRPATPALPVVKLDGAEPAVADAVRGALAAVEAAPRSDQAWGQLGKVLVAHNYLAEARECFANAERFNPREPAYPYLQGFSVLFTDVDEAERCFWRAQQQLDQARSRDQTVRLRLVDLLIAAGRLDEAEGELATAERRVDEKNQQQRCQFYRGLIANRRRQWQEAYDRFTPLLDEASIRELVAAHLAQACEQLGKPDLAARYGAVAEGKVDRFPWRDDYVASCVVLNVGRRGLFRRLSEQEKLNMIAETLRELEGLARDNSRDPLVYFSLAGLYIRQGEYDKADRAVSKAIALEPGRARFHRLKGEVLFSSGEKERQAGHAEPARRKYAEALQEAKRALSLSPKDSEALVQRGRYERALGQLKEAVATLREAAALRPDSANVHQLLGEALAESGQRDEGLIYLQRAVRLAGPGGTAAAALKRWRDKPGK